MLMDANLQFSSGQAITGTADSTYTLDLLTGQKITTSGGTYAVPPSSIIGNNSYFGEDLGLGRGKGTPRIVVTTGAGTPGAGTSLQVAFQGAADNGGGTIGGLTFVTYELSQAVPLASLLANTRIVDMAWPKRAAGAALPRFVKLNYAVVGSNFTGLSVSADVTLGPDSAVGSLNQYPSNF